MISVQKRKSTCSSSTTSTPVGSAQTMAPNHCLSMSHQQQVLCQQQQRQQQQRSKGNGITARKRCKTSGSHQNSASKRTSLNHILENQQHFQNQQQPQSQQQQQQQQQQHRNQQQNEEPVWIFGLINNIEQLLTTFNASGANSSTNPKSAGSTPSFSAAGSPAASSPSCSSTLSSTSSSSSSSPASYASTSGCVGPVTDRLSAAQQQQQQPQLQQNQVNTGRAPSASLPRSPISRQIKFHEYKGPPSAKRQQVSSNKSPVSSQQKQLTQLQQQQSAISRNVLNSSKVNEEQTTITKSTAATSSSSSSTPTPTIVNQRLVDSNVTLASNHIQQQQKQSKLSSTFNQQALTAANSQPISSATVGVSTSQAIKQQQQQRQTQQPMSVSSSRELNLAVFAQPSKQLQQSSRQQEQQQQQQQQLFMQHNQMNFKQHLARPMIQQIQNQTHTIQQQLDARQLSSDQLTSASSQCATNSLGHTFYINQSATPPLAAAAAASCLDSSGSNGDSTRSLILTPTGNHTEVVEVEPSRHQALVNGAFAKPQQHEQPIVVSTQQQSYHDQQLAACLAHQQQNTLVKMETPTSDCQTSCFVRSPSTAVATTSSVATNEAAIFPVELQPFNMFDEELSSYSPILNSNNQQTQQMLDEELNSFGPDSEDIACEIEPSISFSSQVDDLLFSEFIDLQDVPMNVDESDWLKKFLPPCSMS